MSSIFTEDEMTNIEIKNFRNSLGLTQMVFASKLGVTISTVQMWEAGTNKPSPMALARLNKLKKEIDKEKL
jgi:putative transcriptional regulator